MKIINLIEHSKVYTSNVYLVLGSYNSLDAVNTLVDVGADIGIIEKLHNMHTGIGKQKVERVVLTHQHYDHTVILPEIRKVFKPQVYAYSPTLHGVDTLVKDGDMLTMGDQVFEVIHTPGHSHDSICLYCENDGILFVGDTPVIIRSPNGTFGEGIVHLLQRLVRKDVKKIYFGHGPPVTKGAKDILYNSLDNVRMSKSTRANNAID